MSTENARIRLRKRRREIKWITQYAQHIMDNYINKKPGHDVGFAEISQMLKAKGLEIEHAGKRTYKIFGSIKARRYLAVVILTPKFVVIKTCYRHGKILHKSR